MKYHGGADLKTITQENLAALEKGVTKLERHVENVQKNYGIPCVVSITVSTTTRRRARSARLAHHQARAKVVLATQLGRRGKARGTGAHRGRSVRQQGQFPVRVRGQGHALDKINKIAKKIYRASEVTADGKVRAQIKKLQRTATGTIRCAWRKPSILLDRCAAAAAPANHVVNVREVRLGCRGRVRRDDLRGYHDDARASKVPSRSRSTGRRQGLGLF